MANEIFGTPYTDIFCIYIGGISIYPDSGTFTDDGNNPPQTYSCTMNNGANTVAGPYDSITCVIGNNPN